MKKIFYSLFIGAVWSNVALTQENGSFHEIESDIDDLKIKSMNDRIQWSSDFMNSYDNYNTKGFSTAPADRNNNLLFSRMRLHGSTFLNNKLSGHMTFSGSYFYNQTLSSSELSFDAPTEDAQGYSLKIDRAFVNYTVFGGKLSFSFGRLPTMYGPPQNIPTGDERLGTYPTLAYSLPFDGVATTFDLDKLINLNDRFDMRFIYSPISENGSSGGQNGDLVGIRSPVQNRLVRNGKTVQLMLDYETRRINFLESFKVIAQGMYISFGRGKTLEARGVLDSTLAGDRNVYEISSVGPKNLDVKAIVLHTEFEDIVKSGVSFYASLKQTEMIKRGSITATIIEDHEGSALGAKGSSYNLGGFLTGTSDRKGFQQLYGISWRNDSRIFNTGAEYINTHLGSIPSSIVHMHPTDFYNVVGKGEHFYVNYYIVPKIFNLTLGYMNTKAEQRFNSFNYTQDDYKIQNVYLASVVRF